MNKIIVILSTLLFISCKEVPLEEPKPVYEQKYDYGTVMYAKPDSLKVVIQDYDSSDDTYKAYWRVGTEYSNSWYSEEGFYGEAEPNTNKLDE